MELGDNRKEVFHENSHGDKWMTMEYDFNARHNREYCPRSYDEPDYTDYLHGDYKVCPACDHTQCRCYMR